MLPFFRSARALATAAAFSMLPNVSAAAWTPGGVPLTSLGTGTGSTVVEDGQGGVLTYWSDGGGYEVFASRVLADGTPSATLPQSGAHVGTTTFLSSFRGAVRVGGSLYVIAYHPFLSNPNPRLQMFRLSPDGVAAPGWPDTGRRVLERDGPFTPRLAGDGSGGVLMAWFERRPGSITLPISSVQDLYALRLTADGDVAPGWSADGVPVSIPPTGTTPVVSAFALEVVRDGTGGMFVAWQDSSDGIGDVYVQRIDATGGIAPGWPASGRPVCSVASRKYQPQLASDGAGGVYVAWSEHRPPEYAAFLTRIAPDGSNVSGWPAAGIQVTGTGVIAGLRHMVADGSGGAIVGTLEYRDGIQSDVHARRYFADGTLAPGWGGGATVVANAWGDDLAGLLADGAGGAFFLVGNAPGGSTQHGSLTHGVLGESVRPAGGSAHANHPGPASAGRVHGASEAGGCARNAAGDRDRVIWSDPRSRHSLSPGGQLSRWPHDVAGQRQGSSSGREPFGRWLAKRVGKAAERRRLSRQGFSHPADPASLRGSTLSGVPTCPDPPHRPGAAPPRPTASAAAFPVSRPSTRSPGGRSTSTI